MVLGIADIGKRPFKPRNKQLVEFARFPSGVLFAFQLAKARRFGLASCHLVKADEMVREYRRGIYAQSLVNGGQSSEESVTNLFGYCVILRVCLQVGKVDYNADREATKGEGSAGLGNNGSYLGMKTVVFEKLEKRVHRTLLLVGNRKIYRAIRARMDTGEVLQLISRLGPKIHCSG